MENFPGGPVVKNLPSNAALEEGMTTHSSILAWRIPWTEEPGGLQPMGLQRVGHDWIRPKRLSTYAYQCREHGFSPWTGKIPHAAEQLSLWAATPEPAF